MPPEDPFDGVYSDLTQPAGRHFRIVPGSDFLAVEPRALYIGSAGLVLLEDSGGVVEDYLVNAGQILPFRAYRVWDQHVVDSVLMTTTAGGVKGLY